MSVILGIDPGTNFMGYGVIDSQGNKISCLAIGVVDMHKITDPYMKLKMIFDRVTGLVNSYHPDSLSIEAQFYEKNAQSMLKLGRAQGVAIAAAVHSGLQIFEYEPRKIKQAVTGYGNATKEQVANMLARQLSITELPDKFDATDALAAAVCHHYQSKFSAFEVNKVKKTSKKSSSSSSWENFIAQNPDRVKS